MKWIGKTGHGWWLSPDRTHVNGHYFPSEEIIAHGYQCGWSQIKSGEIFEGKLVVTVEKQQSLLEAAEDLSDFMSKTCFPQCVEVKLSNLNEAIEREKRKGTT